VPLDGEGERIRFLSARSALKQAVRTKRLFDAIKPLLSLHGRIELLVLVS
jgi:hypothetical protein